MHMMLSTSLAIFGLIYASAVTGLAIQKRAVDFFDPALGGGSIFDNATFGGEPLNVRPSHLTSECSLIATSDVPLITGDHLRVELPRCAH